ncbi:MAG: hypothetical protein ACI9H8_001757, partial [Lysobacterales bacterium]
FEPDSVIHNQWGSLAPTSRSLSADKAVSRRLGQPLLP